LTVRESAAYLQVSTKTIRRYLKRGLLRAKTVPGDHGEELRVFRKSLDTLAGSVKSLSLDRQEQIEFTRLFSEANPEVRELVLKILRSNTTERQDEPKPTGLLASLFNWKGDDFR
jgi:excisionase family DNA binding protein